MHHHVWGVDNVTKQRQPQDERCTTGGGMRLARDQRGQAMAELALVLPVLLIVLVGMFEFGRLFYYWIDTTQLASESVRWAVVDKMPVVSGTPGALAQRTRDYVCSQAQTREEFDGLQVRIEHNVDGDPNWETGNVALPQGVPVRVQIKRSFAVLGFLGIGSVDLQGSSTMRIEYLEGPGGTTPISWAGSGWLQCGV